jgi:hypothetical protein
MKPSEIRAELLEQHAHVRDLMDATQAIVAGLRSRARTDADALRLSLAHLTDALRTHNLREETLLRDVLPSVDAWGSARTAIMTEEHMAEHARLHAVLPEIEGPAFELGAAGILSLLERIRAHMDLEEAAFLGEDVLCDDIIVVDQSGG